MTTMLKSKSKASSFKKSVEQNREERGQNYQQTNYLTRNQQSRKNINVMAIFLYYARPKNGSKFNRLQYRYGIDILATRIRQDC
jgi:hypothetical protein